MELKNRFKNLKENINKLSYADLESVSHGLIGLMILDLFLFYYILKMKSLAMALLIVMLIAFAIVLYLLTKKEGGKKMKKPKQQDDEDDDEDEDEVEKSNDNSLFEMDIGLPSAEEYNNRLEKAIGIIGTP